MKERIIRYSEVEVVTPPLPDPRGPAYHAFGRVFIAGNVGVGTPLDALKGAIKAHHEFEVYPVEHTYNKSEVDSLFAKTADVNTSLQSLEKAITEDFVKNLTKFRETLRAEVIKDVKEDLRTIYDQELKSLRAEIAALKKNP